MYQVSTTFPAVYHVRKGAGNVSCRYHISCMCRKCGPDLIHFLYLTLHGKEQEMSVFSSVYITTYALLVLSTTSTNNAMVCSSIAKYMADRNNSDPSRRSIISTAARTALHAAWPLFNTDIDDTPNLSTIVTIDTIDHLLTINSLPDHGNHSPWVPLALHQ